MLSHDEKRELFAIAREAIEHALKHEAYALPVAVTGGLAHHCGAFVTIRIDHDLRGCIGYVESEEPLAEVVAEVAAKAALEDPRFVAMKLAEFEHASVEVSVLSPLRRISTVDEIVIGRHGLVVACGARRGLLLPQVAVEHHLDRDAFLEATMHKAGLPRTLWHVPETEIFVFDAEVIHEADVLQ